ncbi:hypothetical protein QR680_015985 [Steinernema hermaphroditum]|uniref:Uncharacterized protein n=1 Tax=Steinernema hermaphroditum TaxID=289476 RepID=A0AA39H9M9_9BILA|nr:hypothetical protein QR680_015985 [Steinernema hermaphroditum]
MGSLNTQIYFCAFALSGFIGDAVNETRALKLSSQCAIRPLQHPAWATSIRGIKISCAQSNRLRVNRRLPKGCRPALPHGQLFVINAGQTQNSLDVDLTNDVTNPAYNLTRSETRFGFGTFHYLMNNLHSVVFAPTVAPTTMDPITTPMIRNGVTVSQVFNGNETIFYDSPNQHMNSNQSKYYSHFSRIQVNLCGTLIPTYQYQ